MEYDLGSFREAIENLVPSKAKLASREVAEPKRDHRSIYAAWQQFHGRGVAKHAW
jgi:hypothetical protein